MTRFLGLVLIVAIALAVPVGVRGAAVVCGTERWDVKTLTDPAATSIDFSPQPATVEPLTALPVPGPIMPHTPRYPSERQTYRVAARLVGFKLETDSDFHV